jgi:hypothetical protein
MLVGTWEQHFDDPGDPLDHYVLELNADHTWRQMIVRGDPREPSAMTVRNAGQWWEIERPDLAAYRPDHLLCLYKDRTKRGIDFRVNGGDAILKVDEDKLHFEPQFETILMPRQFKRWTGAAIPRDVKK